MALIASVLYPVREASMNYVAFLADRLNYFKRVYTQGYDGVILSASVPINLNAAAMEIPLDFNALG